MGVEGNRGSPLRLIVTGGIGSGKSTVVRMLGELGAVVIGADLIGHQVLAPGGAAFGPVADRWPTVVRQGEIDRARLAAIVFTDSDELADLEEITHPLIMREVERQVAAAMDRDVVVEIPVSADLEGDGWVRIVVDAAEDVRLARTVARGMDRGDAAQRMASQRSREQWRAEADFVISNTGTIADLEQAVAALWVTLKEGSPIDDIGRV